MEISLIIKSIIGLVVILSVLIFMLVYSSNRKKEIETITKEKKKKRKLSLVDLKAIIRDTQSTEERFNEALSLVLKDYPSIEINDEQTLDIYLFILMALCRHPKTNTKIIINFEKELIKLNPSYENEINKAVIAGLDSRSL